VFGVETSIADVAVDAAGNIYVTGSTTDSNFPVTPNAYQGTFLESQCGFVPPPSGFPGPGQPIPCPHAFVAKINAAGTELLYAAYLQGSSGDRGSAIVVDDQGAAYVTGATQSPDFPVTDRAFQSSLGPGFLTQLNADGSGLVFSSYLPGAGAKLWRDRGGDLFVAGRSDGERFPTSAGAPQSRRFLGWGDLFVMKFNAAADSLLYATLLGGTLEEALGGFAVDSEGNAYISGLTASTAANERFAPPGEFVPFPVTPGAFRSPGVAADVFVAKINPSGTALAYSAVLGGTGDDAINDLAVDDDGNAYFAGSTRYSPDFPTTAGVVQSAYGGGFLGKLSRNGNELLFSTYLGGGVGDSIDSIRVESSGRVVVRGSTYGPGFRTTADALQPCIPGADPTVYTSHSFAAILDAEGTELIHSTFTERILAMDVAGNAFLPGNDAILSRLNVLAAAPPGPACVVNAAHYQIQAVAPGEVVSIFGVAIGPSQPQAFELESSGPGDMGVVPSDLANTRVLIGGLPAPLLYVSEHQINAVVPFGVDGQPSAAVEVERNGARVGDALEVPVVDAAPGIFTLDASGSGQAAVLNQDGSVNSPQNPAEQDSFISIFLTGVGQLSPAPRDGSVPSGTSAMPVLPIQLSIDGAPQQEPSYAGDAPGLVRGVVQINALVPQLFQTGAVRLVLSAGDTTTPIGVNTTISVK
jgi:uncharacterized protein (TIGR03437 family)